MKKLRLEIELEYDAETMHGDDAESMDWFFNEILSGNKGELILHSNDIGDAVGDVKVLRVFGVEV